MSAGFRYTLRVPEFTKEERSPDDIVVTFQVDILIQIPGSQDTSAPTSVWRRFSEFRQLYVNLKEAFPEIFQEKSMEPPPKKKFRFVNNSDKLLEARRKGLEQWLWKLLRFPEVAQSRDMKLFLQLDLAIRAVNIGGQSSMHSQEFGSPEEGSEPDTDASSMLSVPTTSYSQVNGHSSFFMSGLRSSPSTAITDQVEGNEPLRMGLRVEQRSDLKNVIGALSAYVDKASYDLHEVVQENEKLKQEKQDLAEKLLKAENAISSSGGPQEKVDVRPVANESAQGNMQEANYLHDDRMLTNSQVQTDAVTTFQENETGGTVEKLRQEIELLTQEITSKKSQMDVDKAKSKQDHRLLAKEIARLRETNKELDSEVSSLQQLVAEQPHATEINLLKSNIIELEQKLEKSDQSLEEMQISMDAVRAQESAEQNARITELTHACESHEEEKAVVSEQRSELERLLKAANEKSLLLDGRLRDATKSFDDKHSEYNYQLTVSEKQKQVLDDLNAKIEHLEKDKETLEKNLHAVDTERNQLVDEVSKMRGLKEAMQSLQSELTASALEAGKLAQEKEELEKSQEKVTTEARAQLQNLNQEILAVQKQKSALADEKQEAQSMCSSLKKEISALKNQGLSVSELKVEIEHSQTCISRLTEENSTLKETAKEARTLELTIADLTGNMARLESEKQALKREKNGLETQIENLSQAEDSRSDRIELLEERTRALDGAVAQVHTLKEELINAQERCTQAEDKVHALTMEVQELEASIQSVKNAASSSTDSLTVAHTAEVLRLQTELDSLKHEQSNMKDTLLETDGSPNNPIEAFLVGIRALLTEIHGDIAHCTASVPNLSGQVSLDPDVATDLMESVADCNGKLELATAHVDDIRSSTSDSSEALALAGAVADVMSELIGKCREINEIRVDQLLSRTQIPSKEFGELPKAQKKNSFGGLTFPDLGQSRRNNMPRVASSSGQVPDQDRGHPVDGDSKVKKFWGGVGSKMSAKSQGLMNFMQRGNLQAGLLDDASNEDSSIHPSIPPQ